METMFATYFTYRWFYVSIVLSSSNSLSGDGLVAANVYVRGLERGEWRLCGETLSLRHCGIEKEILLRSSKAQEETCSCPEVSAPEIREQEVSRKGEESSREENYR